jgi:large subunit ribosomal protein L22
MEVIARARYVRRTPRKARLLANMVSGLRVADALAQLQFSPKHAAVDVAKAIKSAAANAENNHNLSRDELWLKQVLVDDGPTSMKRVRPVSRGMAHQYFHRTCHITAIVEDRPEVRPARPASRQAAQEAPARPPRRRAAPKKEVKEEEPVVAAEQAEAEAKPKPRRRRAAPKAEEPSEGEN